MDSITSILNNINTFSKSLFKFSQFFEPLLILKHIPSDISYHLNSNDFLYHLDQASSHLNWLNDFFSNHISKVLHKEVSRLKKTQHIDKTIPYADFTVDGLPVFKKEAPAQISFDDILRESMLNGSPLTPVKRRNPDAFTFHGVCSFCGAPEEYIYDNNGKGQFKCNPCHNTFTLKTDLSGETGIYCPHCGRKLDLKHDRKGYLVYHCPNDKCPYYLKNKKIYDSDKRETLKTSSHQYRLRYHYVD